MPRTVAVRKNGYAKDIGILSRLSEAVKLDDKRSEEWKEATVKALGKVIVLLLNATYGKESVR